MTREAMLSRLRTALEPLDYVYAMWEGGAAAFNRVDAWSDIDLQVDVDDERVGDTLMIIERALQALSPIELKYELPQPTWHGHAQAFYRLRDAGEFLLLDLVVIKHSNPNKFLQPAIHGRALVHFDKANVTQGPPLDRKAFIANLKGRLEALRVTFELFQSLTLKELHRHNDIEALVFYQSATLRPLVEILRIKYQPARYNFHTRYLYYEFPKAVTRKLEELFFIADREDLISKRRAAERMFYETLAQIDLEEVEALLRA